jgi:hypothetical protein
MIVMKCNNTDTIEIDKIQKKVCHTNPVQVCPGITRI